MFELLGTGEAECSLGYLGQFDMKRTFKVEFAIDDVKAFRIAEKVFDEFYNRARAGHNCKNTAFLSKLLKGDS